MDDEDFERHYQPDDEEIRKYNEKWARETLIEYRIGKIKRLIKHFLFYENE